MAAFHPAPDLLFDHVAGALSEPVALMVETHLALCPQCRIEARKFEAVGGAMLEAIDPSPVRSGSLEAVLARLDEPEASSEISVPPTDPIAALLPEPLRGRIAGAQWKRRSAAIEEMSLASTESGVTASLLRIRAGQAVPRHSHRGTEYTLVLAGGFTDDKGHFGRGDMALADSAMTHRPIADADQDCVCLAVVDGGLRLTGPVGRVISLFWRF